jgi:lipid II:glycine glycyltransferase (peptidoglycan interpeptide bridge formation enzyme)
MIFRAAAVTDRDTWQAFLEGTTSGDFLHDWAWADVAAFDDQPQRRFVVADGDRIVALAAAQERPLPLGRRFWYVPHGPVLDYGDDAAPARVAALLDGLCDAARAARAVAVRLEPRLEVGSDGLRAFRGRGLRRVEGSLQVAQTRLVELEDDEALLAGFDKDTRYSVRRADREGVTVSAIHEPENQGAIDALHRLVEETQRRAGFPLPPRERYRVAWRSLAAAGRAIILEARRDDELLASAMLVVEGRQSFYLFSGSRREDPGESKRFASYALQWR